MAHPTQMMNCCQSLSVVLIVILPKFVSLQTSFLATNPTTPPLHPKKLLLNFPPLIQLIPLFINLVKRRKPNRGRNKLNRQFEPFSTHSASSSQYSLSEALITNNAFTDKKSPGKIIMPRRRNIIITFFAEGVRNHLLHYKGIAIPKTYFQTLTTSNGTRLLKECKLFSLEDS
jgi:hypothetical protein